MRSSSLIAFVAAACLAIQGCTIGRQYIGAEITADPEVHLVKGETTMSEVLDIFGAPDVIQRRRHGEIFIYSFLQKNNSQLRLTEPVITRITFFSYQKRQEKVERLVVMFDKQRTVIEYGHTEALDEFDLY